MNLKIERIKRGINQMQLCKIANVSLATVVKLEKGDIDTVKVATLKKISKALGVSIIDLFFCNEQ